MFQLTPLERLALSALCRTHNVARLYLFGSATSDSFDPQASDLDLLVSFATMSPVEHADAYFGLLAGLESLFGRAVDLVEVEAITNPYFRQSVERSRIPLYAA